MSIPRDELYPNPEKSRSQEINHKFSEYEFFNQQWDSKVTAFIQDVRKGVSEEIGIQVVPLANKIQVNRNVAIAACVIGGISILLLIGSFNLNREVKKITTVQCSTEVNK